MAALVDGSGLVLLVDARQELVAQGPAVDGEAQGLEVGVGAALAGRGDVEVGRGIVMLLVMLLVALAAVVVLLVAVGLLGLMGLRLRRRRVRMVRGLGLQLVQRMSRVGWRRVRLRRGVVCGGGHHGGLVWMCGGHRDSCLHRRCLRGNERLAAVRRRRMLVRSTPRGGSFGVVPGVQADLLAAIRGRLARARVCLGDILCSASQSCWLLLWCKVPRRLPLVACRAA